MHQLTGCKSTARRGASGRRRPGLNGHRPVIRPACRALLRLTRRPALPPAALAAGTEPQPPRAQQADVQQAASGGRPPRVSFRTPSPRQSSWAAKEAGGGRSADSDYLSELGAAQQYNINVDHGQRAGMIDSLFTGNVLGHKTDIAGACTRCRRRLPGRGLGLGWGGDTQQQLQAVLARQAEGPGAEGDRSAPTVLAPGPPPETQTAR